MKPVISEFDKYKRQQRRSAWILVISIIIILVFLLQQESFLKNLFIVVSLLCAYGIGRWEIETIQRRKKKNE